MSKDLTKETQIKCQKCGDPEVTVSCYVDGHWRDKVGGIPEVISSTWTVECPCGHIVTRDYRPAQRHTVRH